MNGPLQAAKDALPRSSFVGQQRQEAAFVVLVRLKGLELEASAEDSRRSVENELNTLVQSRQLRKQHTNL